jgi:hypothetical protein
MLAATQGVSIIWSNVPCIHLNPALTFFPNEFVETG